MPHFCLRHRLYTAFKSSMDRPYGAKRMLAFLPALACPGREGNRRMATVGANAALARIIWAFVALEDEARICQACPAIQ